MSETPDTLPDVAITAAEQAVARRAHELGLTLTWEQREALARAALEAAVPYLDAEPS